MLLSMKRMGSLLCKLQAVHMVQVSASVSPPGRVSYMPRTITAIWVQDYSMLTSSLAQAYNRLQITCILWRMRKSEPPQTPAITTVVHTTGISERQEYTVTVYGHINLQIIGYGQTEN